jgi:hypothetical protein
MTERRTAGMKAISILNLLLGLATILPAWAMITAGAGFGAATGGTHGVARAAMTWEFGAARLLLSLLLVLAGIGVWRVQPRGRTLSLRAGFAWLLLNAIEPLVLHYSYAQVAIGSLYPVILIVVCNLPGWKAAFSPATPAPVAEVA